MADLSPTPMLDQIRAGFADRGWPVDDLDRYRMDGTEGDPAPAPAPAPEPAPAPAPAPAADDDLSKFGEHAAYIRELRTENGKYRTERNQARDELGRYSTAFDGLDDATRDTLLALPQHLRSDPKGTATWMREQAEAILAADAGTPDPREGTRDEDRPLTKKEIDRIFADRDRASAEQSELAKVRSDVEKLGITWDSEEANALIAVALKHNGDVAKAHAVMAGWAQQAIDDFVKGKEKAAGQPVPVPAAGQQAGAAVEAPKTFKDAEKAANAWIAARRGTPGQ